jgi:hypothetical protein
VEFNFTRVSKMSDAQGPAPEVLDLFLVKLEDVAALRDVALDLRCRGFASRKANVPLSRLSKESVQMMISALGTLRI